MGVAVAVGVGAVGAVAAVLRMRSISWSPDRHGAAGLDHFSVPGGLSVFAALAGSVSASDPSSAMKSSASPLSDALGLSVSVIVPLLLHCRLWIDVDVRLAVNAAGSSAPFAPSAPIAEPMVTGSKNAS